jgi:putative addiction module killer protein
MHGSTHCVTVKRRPESRCASADCRGGNPGQHRVLKSGVVEMKIDFGPGYRVYFTQRGAELVLLLAGGDKSTQQHDVQLALRLAKEL